MTISTGAVSKLPAEIWDMICENINAPGARCHPRHGHPAANWGGQRDLKNIRLVNRPAYQSASRLVFRSVGQSHSEKGLCALSQLAKSQYASSVRALSMDLGDDWAWSQSFKGGTMDSASQIGSILARFPKLDTIWVVMYPLSQGPCGRCDWSGIRYERVKALALRWLETLKQLGSPQAQLRQLNLVFDSISQTKQFSAQLNTDYPGGQPDSWFQAIMLEESCGPMRERSPHDVRSILSIMPLKAAHSNSLDIAGSIGRDDGYRAYRFMRYIPAMSQLQFLHLKNVDFNGDCLERLLKCNSNTLKSIQLFGVTLRSTYWASIFVAITEYCEQLENLEVGCLGYLLPVSSIFDKLSAEEKEDRISDDTGTLTFLLQTLAARRWRKAMPPIVPDLLCSASEASRAITEPSQVFTNAIETIEKTRVKEFSIVEGDSMTIANDDWKDMLWLHRQLWEG